MIFPDVAGRGAVGENIAMDGIADSYLAKVQAWYDEVNSGTIADYNNLQLSDINTGVGSYVQVCI